MMQGLQIQSCVYWQKCQRVFQFPAVMLPLMDRFPSKVSKVVASPASSKQVLVLWIGSPSNLSGLKHHAIVARDCGRTSSMSEVEILAAHRTSPGFRHCVYHKRPPNCTVRTGLQKMA